MPCPVWRSYCLTLVSGGGAVVKRQGMLVRVSQPSRAVSCDSLMRRLVASQTARGALSDTLVGSRPSPVSFHHRAASRFTVPSGSDVGFSLAACAEDSVRTDASQSPTTTTENCMAAARERVVARKVLFGKVVIVPRPTAARASIGAGQAPVRSSRGGSGKAGSGCEPELLASSLPVGGVPRLGAGPTVCAVVRRRYGARDGVESLTACR